MYKETVVETSRFCSSKVPDQELSSAGVRLCAGIDAQGLVYLSQFENYWESINCNPSFLSNVVNSDNTCHLENSMEHAHQV